MVLEDTYIVLLELQIMHSLLIAKNETKFSLINELIIKLMNLNFLIKIILRLS